MLWSERQNFLGHGFAITKFAWWLIRIPIRRKQRSEPRGKNAGESDCVAQFEASAKHLENTLSHSVGGIRGGESRDIAKIRQKVVKMIGRALVFAWSYHLESEVCTTRTDAHMANAIWFIRCSRTTTAKLPRLPLPGLEETDLESSTAVSKQNAWAAQLQPLC
jgi:hypothetical protein